MKRAPEGIAAHPVTPPEFRLRAARLGPRDASVSWDLRPPQPSDVSAEASAIPPRRRFAPGLTRKGRGGDVVNVGIANLGRPRRWDRGDGQHFIGAALVARPFHDEDASVVGRVWATFGVLMGCAVG